jgi:hypothetical protein
MVVAGVVDGEVVVAVVHQRLHLRRLPARRFRRKTAEIRNLVIQERPRVNVIKLFSAVSYDFS